MTGSIRTRDEDTDESVDAGTVVTVSVSSRGQATIPKVFRDHLGIEAPGKAAFRQTATGEVVVEGVPSASEMRGFAARTAEATTDRAATDLLRAKRDQDRAERDAE